MANGEMKAKLVLEASTQGDDEIIKLRGELDKLKDGADQAGPELAALAAEIEKLGQQQAAIAQFERLKAAQAEAAAHAQKLQQATRDAALALKEKQAALAASTQAEQQASAALAQARTQQSAMGDAIKQLGAELKTMAQAAKGSGDASAAMAEQLKDGKAQLAVLKGEYQGAATAVATLAQAQRESASAAKEAQRDVGAAQKEFDGLRKSAATAKDALASQSQELQRSRDALTGMGISAKALADSQVGLNRGLDASRESLTALAQKAQEAASVLANRELLGVRAHADVQKEIEKTRQAYEQLKASGKLTQAELAQAAMKTEERVRELGKQTNGWASSIAKARGELAGLAASGAGLAVAAKQAIDFETAMANVAKVSNGTQAQMTQLASEIKAMTREIPIAATELAAMAAAGGQLGIPIERLKEFVLLSAQMSTAFGMSAEQTGQAVAKLANIFALPLEGVRNLGDAINVLGNTTAAKEADIVEVLTRIGGTAKQFGLSAQQAAALATAMLSLGTSAEVAGTGINAILSKLQTANIQGQDFQIALAGMGVSAQQLAKDIRDNPQKALSDFLATLSKLEGGKQAELLARLFGIEYQDDVARLLAGLQGYEKALGSAGDAAQVAGAMQKEFQTRVQTTEAQLTLLKNAVSEAGINLGSVLLPAIRGTAEVLRDGAQAMATFSEKHPALAMTATTLLAVGANLTALSLSLKAMQLAASTAFPALTTGALGAGTAVGGLLTVLRTALGPIAALWAAFEGGMYIGEKLRSNFVGIERAGIALAAGLTKAAAMAQAAWEMMKAPFNDDTWEAAQERLRVKLAQIDDEYAQLFASAGKAKTAVQEQGQAADAAGQANTRVSAAVQAVATKMQELASSAQAAGQGAQAASTQLEQVFAQSIKGAQSVAVLEQLREKLDQAKNEGLLTADAVTKLRAQLDQVSASRGVEELVTEFIGLKDSTVGVQGAVEKLVAALKFDDKTSIAAFAGALQELADQGQLSAKQVGEAWQQALGKLNAGQIGALRTNLEEAARQGVISAQQWAAANEQILATSFEKLGVNASQALGKISTGAQEAINNVSLVAESAVAAGVGAQEAARAIEMAFVAAIPKADSLQAVDAMGQQLRAMGASGQVGADGVARMQAALDKQRATIEDQIPGIQSLGEALRQLGVKPQAELDELARTSKEAFDVVKASGTATPREINAAWKAMAEAAIEANDGVADSSIKAQAQAHGFVVKTDAAGKSTIESMKGAKDATDETGEAAKEAGEDYEKLGHLAEEAGAKVDVTKEHFLDATRAQSQYAQEAYDQWMKLVGSSTDYIYSTAAGFAKLQQGMKDMVDGLEELDRQQQELNNNSAQGVADLELRLLELQGTEEEVAAARAARESAEVEKKRALLELDVQRARLRGDKEEVARLTEELGLLDKQLALLQKIHAEEKKQRTEREREEKNREREKVGGGSGGSGGSAAGGGSSGGGSRPGATPERGPATVPTQPPAQAPGLGGQQPQRPVANITINANGINDPVKLARLLEPELKRLAVLAR